MCKSRSEVRGFTATPCRFLRETGNLDFHMKLEIFLPNVSNKLKVFKILCRPKISVCGTYLTFRAPPGPLP